jgi:hypothetical protein
MAVMDLRTGLWTTDTPPLQASSGIDALVNYGRVVAYCSGGVVYAQNSGFIDGANSFIDLQALTNPLYPLGIGGYGLIYEALLTGEYRGDCDIDLRVSYDDGKNFTALASFALTGLTVGQTVQKKWTLPQLSTGSIVLEFSITSTGAVGATEGFIFQELDLLVELEEGLRQLDPGDNA